MSSTSGDRLIEDLAEGRADALVALHDRFAGALFQAAFTMLGSRQDAEDAVQDVFISLVRARQRLAGIENLRAYLFAMLRHAALKVSAVRRRMPPVVSPLDASAASSFDLNAIEEARASPSETECADQLEQALRRLPPPQRELIALKVDGELTFGEIGALLGISPNTAAGRYRYALEKLRTALLENADGLYPPSR